MRGRKLGPERRLERSLAIRQFREEPSCPLAAVWGGCFDPIFDASVLPPDDLVFNESAVIVSAVGDRARF